jgi:glycosyltransferase involved in cell wall biosynthesis
MHTDPKRGDERRVLQITPYYPPHLGGMERVAEALAGKLAERREVEVFTTALGGTPSVVQPSAVVQPSVVQPSVVDVSPRVHRFPAAEVAHTPVSWRIFAALLRTPRGAVWHLHCAHALIAEQVMVAARLRGQKYLLHFHLDVGASGPLGRLLPFYKKHFFARAARAAAVVIVLTESQAEFIERAYRVPRDRIRVVPNGVAQRYFGAPRRSGGDRPLQLLFVGRLEVQKNVARLIEALGLATEKIELRVVGEGPLRGELEQRASSLGVSVEFAGSLFDDDLLRAYEQADAFVMPSDHEGMPLAVLEAMASGLPVVATDVPGNRELVAGRGLLAAPEPAELAAALDRVAADAGFRSTLAEQCSAAAGAYSWDAVADRVELIYREVYS